MTSMDRLALRLTADGVAEVHRVVFLRALEAGLALEDLVIVPRKATEAMDSVGYVAIDMHTDASGPLQDAATKVWDAMIAEATKP